MQAAVMANSWRGKGKAFQPEDFMPVKRESSAAQQHAEFRANVGKFNGEKS
ncbi:MAG: hypothetical protein HOL01_07570 [Planctomycetaceae bacterium]|jgi:hypothetical protein|nr:hypothetical protein [Planctomycetaceae bacterium]MBT6485545.1 hypothetical protein [Planctomycetaceae bacterium]MBT6494395.1 hypothetical protein [Planctomycetaceae bacterium]